MPDYPAAKLDIKLVLEEGDEETLAAAKALRLPSHFEFIIVPKSEPLTKPKALNYALPFARGEFLVVYDAEDIPAPDQLRMAVAAFDAGGPRLACVQGQLMFYNARETWLTRQSAIEYAALFELLLPALARFSLPFPLGGTSTHFRTDILKAAGAWDPFNVTEDADLGLRLHELGYRTTLIPSLTQEEATLTLDAWMRQRTRWLKGWMQTLLVRLKAPLRMARALRPAGFIFSFIVLGGFVLAALLHPLAYVMAGGLILSAFFGLVSGDPLATFHLTVLIVGAAASITAGLAAGLRRFGPAIALHALLMPFYWLLISAASYRALWQLIRKPDYWEKTRHGLSRLKPDKSR
ncbi:glycosyltransferase family 2 protein [Tepidicaulis sp. LMO-SS28]|uniref:glycosyltransferase family 2 protein n=1 Tax=Tepidicaulis sp. LMO-SS28 TaxID=3447455 RepID=UPI003EE1EBC8